MPTVIGVRFKPAGKIYYFSPDDLAITTDDHVIVETSRGVEYGEVVIAPREVDESAIVSPLKSVIRVATPEDEQKVAVNHQKEAEAFDVCLKKSPITICR